MPRNEGQIIKKGPGKYQIRIALRGKQFARRTYAITLNCTAAHARKEMRRLLVERDRGTLLSPVSLTVSEWLDEWLTGVVAATVRQRTLDTYRDLAKRYIYPFFAEHAVQDISRADVERWVTHLRERKLSAGTIRHVFSVLNGAMASLVTNERLAANPCTGVKKPKVRRPNITPLTVDQAKVLLAALPAEPLGALWGLLLTAALRPSEALALTWDDVADGKVHVRRSLTWGSTGPIIDKPKTEQGYRSIPIDPFVRRLLQAHWQRSPFKEPPHLVFCNASGGPLNQKVLSRRRFPRMLKRLGLPEIRLYDLRHTGTTLLLLSGATVTALKERLGHKDAAYLIDTYTHVLPNQQEATTGALSHLLGTVQPATTAPASPAE
ncbi:MAG: site-specific integrase [Gemmatimonadetes bacterium]|nr:site-specific integrase [Gemmatimonadota bacterium]